MQEVAAKCGYENDTFLLSYERQDGGQLGEVGFVRREQVHMLEFSFACPLLTFSTGWYSFCRCV